MESQNSSRTTQVVVLLAVIAVVIGFAWWLSTKSEQPAFANLDGFAQCLSDKKVTMYGAAWCSHCQNQKKLFGPSFKYVPYVECPDNIQVCKDKGVEGYPTWIFGDGKKVEGEQRLEQLAQDSGCALKQENSK
ncbi:MAG: hypothetical protein Q8N81_02180 [bacterium]|nr:hypothetical protein [bacterium]